MAKAAKKHEARGTVFLRRQRDTIAESIRAASEHRKLYNTAAYRRFRHDFLADHPLCLECEAEDRLTPATAVHHFRKLVLHPEDICDGEFCQALCKHHHDQKTARGE